MTLHDIISNQFQSNASQIQAYQQDIANLLAMLTQLQQTQQVLTTWLSQNPGP